MLATRTQASADIHAGRSPANEPCTANLSFDAAITLLAWNCTPLGKETVKLAKAGRRVLAAPLVSQIDAPRFDAAAMDGFAVRSADLESGLRNFDIAGASYPGESWKGSQHSGQAVRIMTGGRMPTGIDRVIPWELVEDTGDRIELKRELPRRSHVRPRGSDLMAGSVVLPAGRVLDPNSLVAAAAADVGMVTVWKQPRVHVVATGDELAVAGSAEATADMIPESLTEALLLFARQWGGKPQGATIVPDATDLITNAARNACADCDVLVMHGGASRGDRDFAKAALRQLGLEIVFADVAMKPGKPVWYGRIGKVHVLGLPGNPTAAMTVARLFLAPLLAALGGRPFDDGLRWKHMPLSASTSANGEREAFLCACFEDDSIRIIESQSASSQFTLGLTNALVRLRPNERSLSEPSTVQALKF